MDRMFKRAFGVAKVVVPIAVGAYGVYKTWQAVEEVRAQIRMKEELEGLTDHVDKDDLDIGDCIEVVAETATVPEGSTAIVPKGLHKNKIQKGKRRNYAMVVAQHVRAAYPNLGEGQVDRELARRKATAIMAEHGMRASHVMEALPIVESLVFMRSAREMRYDELKRSWWWFWTERGLKPSRRA